MRNDCKKRMNIHTKENNSFIKNTEATSLVKEEDKISYHFMILITIVLILFGQKRGYVSMIPITISLENKHD